jgi:hypothetical protein
MRRRTKALIGVAVVVAVAFFFFAPVVYSPTTVYGGLYLQTYPTYPNWESLSCWAFGFGMYYGRTVQLVPAPNGSGISGSAGASMFKYGNATQFGCPPASTSILP